jgi:SAM-dependent methyltransferase
VARRVRGPKSGVTRAAFGSARATRDQAGATLHYDDPLYYDKTYSSRRHDVDYYVDLAKQASGPVLEYGIGTGRVALAFARAGIEVVGVDRSRPMLRGLGDRLAREKEEVRRRVSVVRGDMRSVKLARRFPLVIAPFNAVMHLYDRRDVERFFARVRQHLTARGRFVFDFLMPSPEDLDADPDRRYGAPRIRHPTAGKLVRYGERFEYDARRQVLWVRMEFEPEDGSRPWVVPLSHRQFFPQEMEALLHYNGFTNIELTAEFSGEPLTASTESIVVSCRARSRNAGAAG